MDIVEQALEMDRKFGFDGINMTEEFLAFRMRFELEEQLEEIKAAEAGDWDKFVDAEIDKIVVAIGTLTIAGVDVREAWSRVWLANMAKERKDNPTRTGAGGFDLVKPDGWTAPTHADNVGRFSMLDEVELSEHFSHSVTVLLEAVELQFRKNHDYASQGFKRADYFIHGLADLEYECNKKWLRIRSVLRLVKPNFESLEDSMVDLINYLSFMVAWVRGRLEGQNR